MKNYKNSLGEQLCLQDILLHCTVVSITIQYEILLPVQSWWRKIFGGAAVFQASSTTVIVEEAGMLLQVVDDVAVIKTQQRVVLNENVCESTIIQNYVLTPVNPHRVNFNPGNILEMDWIKIKGE